MTPPTQRLAEFAATLAYAQIPSAVRAAARQYLLDTIAVAS